MKFFNQTSSIILISLFILSISAANAGECFNLYNTEKYSLAFPVCKQAAEQGDVEAQNNLGVMYMLGQGVVQDYKQSINWFNKAARQGNV